jgi:hypothetical protein
MASPSNQSVSVEGTNLEEEQDDDLESEDNLEER